MCLGCSRPEIRVRGCSEKVPFALGEAGSESLGPVALAHCVPSRECAAAKFTTVFKLHHRHRRTSRFPPTLSKYKHYSLSQPTLTASCVADSTLSLSKRILSRVECSRENTRSSVFSLLSPFTRFFTPDSSQSIFQDPQHQVLRLSRADSLIPLSTISSLFGSPLPFTIFIAPYTFLPQPPALPSILPRLPLLASSPLPISISRVYQSLPTVFHGTRNSTTSHASHERMPDMSAPLLGDQAALGISSEEQASNPNPATSKVDYTQGFGSFLFLPHDPKPIRKSRQTKTRFPLLKLPLEIRYMIYRCLVDGLVMAGSDSSTDATRTDAGLRFRVREGEDPFDGYDPAHCHERPVPPLFTQEAPEQRNTQPDINRTTNTNILDVFGVDRIIADPSYPQAAVNPNAARFTWLYSEIQAMNDSVESDEAEFSDAEDSDALSWCSDEAEIIIHKRWRHDAQAKSSGTFTRDWVVNMDGEYDTELSQANAGNSVLPTTFRIITTIEAGPKSARPSHQRNQKKVRAAIRNLSLASALIALELGEVLWAKATVHFESRKGFLAFARDRPTALPLIHGIVVDLDIDDGDWLIEDTSPAMAEMVRVASEQGGNLRSWKT